MADPAITPAVPAVPAVPVTPVTPSPGATPVEPTTPAEPLVKPLVKPGDAPGQTLESYSDFTLPEGVNLDATLMDKATPIFKGLGLNQEQAQKLVDFQAEMVKEGTQSQTDAFNQLIEGWKKDTENDKEFGGENFDENLGIAKLALDKFATPEFKELIADHGIAYHPEFVRYNLAIGKLLKEDSPGRLGNAPSQKQDRVSVLYPNDKKE